MIIKSSKLGFGHREQSALEDQLDEGMNPFYWYDWTNMGFDDDDPDYDPDDGLSDEEDIGWKAFDSLGYDDPDERRTSQEDWDDSFLNEEIDFREDEYRRYEMYRDLDEEIY